MTELITIAHYNWIMLPPGKTAILRFPFAGKIEDVVLPKGLSNPRLATPAELIVANQGRPYPWGDAKDMVKSRMWNEKRIGIGGLIHNAWFVTSGGRFGAAPNVLETGNAALRYYMYLDGGFEPTGTLADNEGFAVVADVESSYSGYMDIQLHAATHVVADRGAISVSPKDDDDKFTVAFVGRCMTCPKPEMVSVVALQEACPHLKIELHPDWKGWEL